MAVTVDSGASYEAEDEVEESATKTVVSPSDPCVRPLSCPSYPLYAHPSTPRPHTPSTESLHCAAPTGEAAAWFLDLWLLSELLTLDTSQVRPGKLVGWESSHYLH